MKLMASEQPLVSVIVPAYNAERFIRRTLASALAQTYTNLEVLVVDDGSTDATVAIVQEVAALDARVKLFSQSNMGVAAARNLAINHSRGAFIAPLDADDIWFPEKIARQVACLLEAGPAAGVAYCWSVRINEEDEILGYSRPWRYEGNVLGVLVYHNFLGNGSMPLIRRESLEKAGLYDPGLRAQGGQGCEDRDLYLRLAATCEYRLVADYLVGYRRVADSMSRNYRAMLRSHELVMEAARLRHPVLPRRLFRWSEANFCLYAADIGAKGGRYGDAVRLLGRAMIKDPVMWLSSPRPLKSLLASLGKWLTARMGVPSGYEWAKRLVDTVARRPSRVSAQDARTLNSLQERLQRRRIASLLDVVNAEQAQLGAGPSKDASSGQSELASAGNG